MRTSAPKWGHTYQLVLSDDGAGVPRRIEFEASGPEAALYVAQRHCGGREAELFEDDRSLGRLKCAGPAGFWMLSRGASPRQA